MDVPFVGTKSYQTLLDWIYRMNIDINNVSMMNAYDVEGKLTDNLVWIARNTSRVITLGVPAAAALAGEGVKYFALPHPSGLNRELNDKKRIGELLTRCREYVYKQDRENR